MKNTIARFGKVLGSLVIAGGLMTSALFAGTAPVVTVTLPHDVTVGNATLPSGQYTISMVDMASGDEIFIIRSEKGNLAATLQGQKVISATGSQRTQVGMSKNGDTWNLDSLAIRGDEVSYQFAK